MTSPKHFDVLVIGGGPGGYVAAIRAAQLGLKTGLVEREALGGVCLNWGCIPTKALLKAAEIARTAHHAEEFGLTLKIEKIDFTKVIARSREVSSKLSQGVSFLMKKHKVEVIPGTANFLNEKEVEVTNAEGTRQTVGFTNAIIATGARPKQIPGVLEADGKYIWTSKEAMVPTELPKSLLIVGAGAIGVEFASFYNALGTKVTLVEAQPRIVPVEDEEIAKLLKTELEKQGITILTEAKLEGLKAEKEGVSATVNGKKETFSRAILAIGVTGNVENLGLANLGVAAAKAGAPGLGIDALVEKGAIKVNDSYQTAVPNVYAIGDVAGAPWLAHVASHEGVIAAEHIAYTAGKAKHKPHAMNYGNIPGCTYCTPQVASTGLTEAAAKAAGKKLKVGKFPYTSNGKALAIGEPTGLVKTIYDAETGELLGAHIIGAEATEMISTFVLGRHMEMVEADLQTACLPHPTLSEMLAEAALAADNRALNG